MATEEMASKIPTSMRAIVLSKYVKPAEYNLASVPVPTINKEDEVLIKVHAASVNPVDVKMAAGAMKAMLNATFPYLVGYDLSGTVTSTHPSVTTLKVGDQVFTRVPDTHRGTLAEYAVSTSAVTAVKPASLSFTTAAAIPLVGLTALQALQKADSLLEGGLKGKTVFVPAGLSGTGSIAVQLAKHVFGAGKVITTLSTKKIPTFTTLIGEGAADQVIDYTKEDVAKAIGKGNVDFFFDTMGAAFSGLSFMKKGGVVLSISSLPFGTELKRDMTPDMPGWLRVVLDKVYGGFQRYVSWRYGGVKYYYMLMHGDREGLENLAKWVEEGKLKIVVGETKKLEDLEGVRKAAGTVFDAKGGVGKFVVEVE
jgi:NADPH:quinone reductase-like Zn-dependent oxidoreductase